MPQLSRHILTATLAAVIIPLMSSFQVLYPNYENLTVIGHSNSVNAKLEKNDFEQILHGEKKIWGNGKDIVIALMKSSHPTGKMTAEKIYHLSGNEMNRLWLGLVFEGKAKAPKFFMSEEELVSFVSATPGAIGVVSESSPISSVKKIHIDGNN